MSEADRRFKRYVVPEGAMASQGIRGKSFIAKLTGWTKCRIKDLSRAGAMVLTEKNLSIGDSIEFKMVEKEGQEMLFDGTVANIAKDHKLGMYKVGVAINVPATASLELSFLETLSDRFKEAI